VSYLLDTDMCIYWLNGRQGVRDRLLTCMVLTNSWMVWIIGILGVMLNVLAPLTEEPWLEERFGDRYLAYRRRVPRFFWIGKRDNAA
jgi:protein-S-isoprenylcysteine O-methyltransferase Ste14